MTPLCELAKKYGTDKYDPHNYTPVYYQMLEDRTDKVREVLEIGIGRGARSLQMWEEFFPNAQIYGVDVDNGALYNSGRVRSFKLNQTNRAEMYQLGRHYGKFDLIVEDGDHNPKAQLAAIEVLLPFVADNGFYFMEDIYADLATMTRNLPVGYSHSFFESKKVVESGLRHWMMMVKKSA